MQVSELQPPVAESVAFRRSEVDKVPAAAGCYVLAGSSDQILYIGQSEVSIRARFADHIGDASKRGVERFHYRKDADPRKTEREWLDQYARRSRGNKPPLHD